MGDRLRPPAQQRCADPIRHRGLPTARRSLPPPAPAASASPVFPSSAGSPRYPSPFPLSHCQSSVLQPATPRSWESARHGCADSLRIPQCRMGMLLPHHQHDERTIYCPAVQRLLQLDASWLVRCLVGGSRPALRAALTPGSTGGQPHDSLVHQPDSV